MHRVAVVGDSCHVSPPRSERADVTWKSQCRIKQQRGCVLTHTGRVPALMPCIVIDTLHLNGYNVNGHFGTFTRRLLMH